MEADDIEAGSNQGNEMAVESVQQLGFPFSPVFVEILPDLDECQNAGTATVT